MPLRARGVPAALGQVSSAEGWLLLLLEVDLLVAVGRGEGAEMTIRRAPVCGAGGGGGVHMPCSDRCHHGQVTAAGGDKEVYVTVIRHKPPHRLLRKVHCGSKFTKLIV